MVSGEKVFRLTGDFRQAHHTQDFSKEIIAQSPEHAKELMLSLLGSKHAVPRRYVRIAKVVEVPRDEIQDPVVRHVVGA